MFQKNWNPWPIFIGMAGANNAHPGFYRQKMGWGGFLLGNEALKKKVEKEKHRFSPPPEETFFRGSDF